MARGRQASDVVDTVQGGKAWRNQAAVQGTPTPLLYSLDDISISDEIAELGVPSGQPEAVEV